MRKRLWIWDALLALLLCGGFLLLADALIPFDFDVNDDTAMISILNGTYSGTPDAHTVFIGYPISWVISRLYATGVRICWYKWTLLGCVAVALASVLYRLFRRFPGGRWLSAAAVLGCFSFFWLTPTMHTTYTLCSGLAMGCTILSYAIQPAEEDVKPLALLHLLLLFTLTYQLRDYFGYLVVPFLGVLWLGKHWGELRRNRACWLVPVAGLLCFGVLETADRLPYSGDWATFKAYNNARSYLQDFNNFPDYDEHETFIRELGFDRDEYKTLSRYTYLMLEDYEPAQLMALYEYAKGLEQPVPLTQRAEKAVRRAISTYLPESLSALTPLRAGSYLLPLALLGWAAVYSVRKRRLLLLTPLLLLLGCAGMWLIVADQGRTPTRVMYPLRLMFIAASLSGFAVVLGRCPVQWKQRSWQRPVTVALSAALAVLCVAGVLNARQSQSGYSAPKGDYLRYAAAHPDEIFIRDIKSTVSANHDALVEFPRAPVNLLSTGGWTVYSPLYYEKLDTLGIPAVNRSLLLRDHVYLILNLDKYTPQRVMGLSKNTAVDYEVVETFNNHLSMVKIHSIG